MKMIWVQFSIVEQWNQPQNYKRFGWTFDHIKLFDKVIIVAHGWATIEVAKMWVENI